MSFLKEWYAKEKEKFYSHVPVWVAIGAEACKAAGRRLTWEEYVEIIEMCGCGNSYTRKVLLPTLDDLAVCRLTDYCMSQSGRNLGELDLAEHYGDAVQRELAPLLVKRLSEAACLLKMTREAAAEWGRCRETIAHLKKSVTGQQKRADKLEADFLELQKDWLKATETAAAWEVQAQDLRDRLVQAERERHALRTVATKLANYLETANGLLEANGEDEDDIADARELIAEAREILPRQTKEECR